MPLEQLQHGRYRLQQFVGSGSMGEVYLAEDTRIHRSVAIKVIRSEPVSYGETETLKDATRLFEQEAQTIARFDHPNILSLYDYGEEENNGSPLTYMVMPFCEAGTLASWLRQRGSSLLPPADVAYLLIQAARALQHAHDRGIVHRDVKPSNFLIRSNRDNPNRPDLLLADFGIARLVASTASASQAIRGTPASMAPEQWRGMPAPASDQYALAVIAYELLTGHEPFQGSFEQVMYQHFSANPLPPSQLNPALSPVVDQVFTLALAKQPEARFASVTAFARALEQALQQPTGEHPLTIIRTTGANVGSLSDAQTIYQSGDAAQRPGVQWGAPVPVDHTLDISLQHAAIPREAVQQRQSWSKTIIALCIVIALIVGAGSGTLFFLIRNAPSHIGQQTNTLANSSTPAASTGHAATATAQATVNAMATSQSNSAATATAVAQASLDPYNPGGRLVLADPLSDNSRGNNWLTGANSRNATCEFNAGAYYSTQPAQGFFHSCIAQHTNFSNFDFEVQATLISGDYAGIIFCNATSDTYYLFRIGPSGYALMIFSPQNPAGSNLTQGLTAIGIDQPSLLAVEDGSGVIKLFVNHQLIDSVNDSAYSNGRIAVFTWNASGNTAQARFENARVWQF